MPKISFIVPVYKAEKYLPRLISSIKEQTMPDFEAIFVNDGSPDDSASLCTRLFDGDNRFKLISKENGGVSSVRNAGLDAAVGEYIFFVDCDDTIETDSARLLINAAEGADADIVFFGRFNDYYMGDKLTKTTTSLPHIL